jgi:hypothetical protein
MVRGEFITELLSSVSSEALQAGKKPSKREAAKPFKPKPSNQKPSNQKPSPRDGKPLSGPHGSHAVARSDTSDEDADQRATDAFSVSQFCKRHGFSPQLFYKFRKEMPDTFRIGGRVLISREAAVRWRAEREAANA